MIFADWRHLRETNTASSSLLVSISFKRGHTMKLSKQRTSLDVRKFSFSQRVVQEWNKLSQDVVDATSVNQFKNRLDKFWRSYHGH